MNVFSEAKRIKSKKEKTARQIAAAENKRQAVQIAWWRNKRALIWQKLKDSRSPHFRIRPCKATLYGEIAAIDQILEDGRAARVGTICLYEVTDDHWRGSDESPEQSVTTAFIGLKEILNRSAIVCTVFDNDASIDQFLNDLAKYFVDLV